MPATAYSQPAGLSADEVTALRAELQALRAQVQALEARVGQAEAVSASAEQSAQKATEMVASQPASPQIKFKGAPEFSDKESGWSFKPRGRLEMDAGYVSTPDGISDPTLGFASRVRRAYLGAEGKIPGGFGYRLELDFAGGDASFTDAYLTYQDGSLGVTLGHQKPPVSLETLTSDLDTSLIERAAFTSAFGFERRLGVAVDYNLGNVLVSGGIFSDDIDSIRGSADNSYSVDGRIVWMPKIGNTQLHLGGSASWRDMNDLADGTVSYRARPGTRTTDFRPVSLAGLNVSKEAGFGLEALAINGPFHAMAETYWFRPELAATGQSAHLFGGYGEVGYFLTRGDGRSYKNGVLKGIKPAKGLDQQGPGAIQLVLRYDYLDLIDRSAGLVGGKQNGYYAGISWVPVEHIKFMLNYGRVEFDDAAKATATGDRNYGVDTVVGRAQFDF